jgi:hypothetical protein
MPLGEVSKGMRCTAYSVLQGVEVESFGAEVVDVVAGDPAADAPRILMRFSGANIERTGVGPGFSGSPIYCDGRVIGAISEAVGEYGGLLALATPIESILGEPVDPPAATRPAPPGARALRAPLTLSGVSTRVGSFLARAARRAGRTLYAAPGTPRQSAFPFQQLRPGASMAAGLASGDLTAGSVGTVAYVDGDRVWGFGHPLDGAGRRSLFLQDAYVYAVVNNPVGVEGAGTYKLAAPGHDVGTLSGDGQSAVAGRLGVLPARFPMKVIARDQDTRSQRVTALNIADESAAGLPTGGSALGIAGAGAVAQAATTILRSSPARQTGELCARIQVRERRRPFRFCNRYVTRSAGEDAALEGNLGAGGAMAADFAEAAIAIDEFNFAELHVTGVEVNLKLRRGLRQAFLVAGRGPARVRRGTTARLRLRVQEVRGPARWRTVRVRVPRDTPRGERVITLTGAPADSAAGLEVDLGELLFDGEGADGLPAEELDEAGPRTIESLARSIARISRYDGVVASFRQSADDESPGRDARRVLRDPELRLSGSVRIPVDVR